MTRTADRLELEIPLVYMETTIPPGLTLGEYARSRPRRPSRWQRLKELAGSVGVAAEARPA
jgi:hypothetical protein